MAKVATKTKSKKVAKKTGRKITPIDQVKADPVPKELNLEDIRNAPRTRKTKYPYQEWAAAGKGKLVPGKHFDVPIVNMKAMLYTWAKKQARKIFVTVRSDNSGSEYLLYEMDPKPVKKGGK